MARIFASIDDLDITGVKWIDARYSLQNPEEGRAQYAKEHVAGAVHWDLDRDLSDASIRGGRHPLPGKEQLTELFRAGGLDLDDIIIVYDQGGSPFAARAWWILQYAGFKHAYIALEGFDQLKQSGIQTNDELVAPKRTNIIPNWQDHLSASRDDVISIVEGSQNAVLLDARAPERYRGEHEPIDPVAGHIPTAVNFDWVQLKRDSRYAVEEVKDELLQRVSPDEEVVVYCGSGVTAAPLYAALKQLDYPNVRLYVGSFSDWISEGDLPVEQGSR